MSVHSFMVKYKVCLTNPQNMAPLDSRGDTVVESISLFLTQCLSVKHHTTTVVLHPQSPTSHSKINPSGAGLRSGQFITKSCGQIQQRRFHSISEGCEILQTPLSMSSKTKKKIFINKPKLPQTKKSQNCNFQSWRRAKPLNQTLILTKWNLSDLF